MKLHNDDLHTLNRALRHARNVGAFAAISIHPDTPAQEAAIREILRESFLEDNYQSGTAEWWSYATSREDLGHSATAIVFRARGVDPEVERHPVHTTI